MKCKDKVVSIYCKN